jgi:ketosteroid isomerase-like protein
MKTIILFLWITASVNASAQLKDEAAIRKILNNQSAAWNNGNLQEFMKGYWHNDSLMFIGKSGITYGWQQTLNNYKKGYPDTSAIGKLNFEILQVKRLSHEYYFVIGKWFLKRSIGDVGGHFTLLFRKIKNNWAIIADHSS